MSSARSLITAAAGPICLLVLLLTALPGQTADEQAAAASILRCYHPTAEMTGYRMHKDLSVAARYDADDANIYDISFRGFLTGNEYRFSAAFLVRKRDGILQYRSEVMNDTAVVPSDSDCRLRDWINSKQ